MSTRGATRGSGGIRVLLDWIDALRRGDRDRIAALLDPEVTWSGLTDDLACVGRDEVLGVVEDQLPMCVRTEALELLVAPGHLILGTCDRSLPDPPGIELDGQIYNVFELVDGRIRTIRDFAVREHAMRSAGLDDEGPWR